MLLAMLTLDGRIRKVEGRFWSWGVHYYHSFKKSMRKTKFVHLPIGARSADPSKEMEPMETSNNCGFEGFLDDDAKCSGLDTDCI